MLARLVVVVAIFFNGLRQVGGGVLDEVVADRVEEGAGFVDGEPSEAGLDGVITVARAAMSEANRERGWDDG